MGVRMHALFTIEHEPGDLLAVLAPTFGDPGDEVRADAFQKSLLLADVKNRADYYISDQRTHLISGVRRGAQTLELTVEPLRSVDLRKTCETVWRELTQQGRRLKPRLGSLTFESETVGRPVAHASTGLGPQLGRLDLLYPFVVAAGTGIWLIVALQAFDASGDLVLGAIPSLLAGVVAVGALLLNLSRKNLVWS
jgi:hypothetical protein